MGPRFFDRFRKGILRVSVTGGSPERFFNLLSANGMDIWNVKTQEASFSCLMTVPEFRLIRPLARKAGVQVRIQNRQGMPFLFVRGRKRMGLMTGMAAFFLVLYILSLFIWNISFEGNSHYSRDTLLNFLEDQGIVYGMRKGEILCSELEEQIRSGFPEITWVSARVSGTRLLIKVKENEALSHVEKRETGPRQLTAAREGLITRMIVRQGRAAVAAGDQVEKGQLLISSELPITDDSGQLLRMAYVHADGDVYARTTHTYQKTIPRYRAVRQKTGKKRYGFGISCGDRRLRFLFPALGDRPWSYTTEHRQLCLFNDFYLPVSLEWICGEEYDSQWRSYTKKEQKTLALMEENRILKNFREKGVQIIENSVKIQKNGNHCIIEGTVICEEQIGVPEPAVPEEMQKDPKEPEENRP